MLTFFVFYRHLPFEMCMSARLLFHFWRLCWWSPSSLSSACRIFGGCCHKMMPLLFCIYVPFNISTFYHIFIHKIYEQSVSANGQRQRVSTDYQRHLRNAPQFVLVYFITLCESVRAFGSQLDCLGALAQFWLFKKFMISLAFSVASQKFKLPMGR